MNHSTHWPKVSACVWFCVLLIYLPVIIVKNRSYMKKLLHKRAWLASSMTWRPTKHAVKGIVLFKTNSIQQSFRFTNIMHVETQFFFLNNKKDTTQTCNASISICNKVVHSFTWHLKNMFVLHVTQRKHYSVRIKVALFNTSCLGCVRQF